MVVEHGEDVFVENNPKISQYTNQMMVPLINAYVKWVNGHFFDDNTVINEPERGGGGGVFHRSVSGYVILRWVTIDILFLYTRLLDHTAARPLGSCARPQLLGHGPWSLVDCSAIILDHGLRAVCILFGL
ncbi:hypothetical protein ACB098_09G140400 [Castanea mollissima]